MEVCNLWIFEKMAYRFRLRKSARWVAEGKELYPFLLSLSAMQKLLAILKANGNTSVEKICNCFSALVLAIQKYKLQGVVSIIGQGTRVLMARENHKYKNDEI